MSEKQTPDISPKNPYWVERQRYYELKHFCLQYHHWKQQLKDINLYPSLGREVKSNDIFDPVTRAVVMRMGYRNNIELIENAASMTDNAVGPYILTGVTGGLSYEVMSAKITMPCSKDAYYELYRKFFWILDGLRG